ncbi:arylesterase [Candidatus Peregrinibacteria bacterium]|nr:arylesterase [bacterium]NCQ55813.1 arylesterase [Candidatus Parcubacteria bacterium]NCS67880.1 arylesterase [Candidatus Peregrinibacteria bacterium]
MRAQLLFVGFIALFTTACGGSSINELRPTTGNIVFLGDSITEGYQVEVAQNYPSLIQNKLDAAGFGDYQVVNLGITGDKSVDGLNRLEAVLAAEPEIVVLALGGNDFLQGTTLNEVQSNLETIIETLQAQNVEVLLVGIVAPPLKGLGYTRQVKSMYESLAETYELKFMPNILKGLVLDQRYMMPDNVHPKPAGYVLIAESLWGYLEPLLRS